MIPKIRAKINSMIGEKIIIKYSLGRNKYEEYECTIHKTYNNVFLVKILNKREIKCFTYCDILTKTIIITSLQF